METVEFLLKNTISKTISGHLMMTLSMTIWRVMSTTTRNSQQGGIIFNFKDKTESVQARAGYNNSFD